HIRALLRLMARELAEMVKRMPKLDWTQRESVRADLRRSVRRLLARYGYPPDLSEDATQLVLQQAANSTEYLLDLAQSSPMAAYAATRPLRPTLRLRFAIQQVKKKSVARQAQFPRMGKERRAMLLRCFAMVV